MKDAGSTERADVEVVIGSSMWALEVMVPCPAAATWAHAAHQPLGVANAAAAAKEAEYAFLVNRGVSVSAIVVDTSGGIAQKSLRFLSQAVRDCAHQVSEWGPRVEAAVVRLQFGMITGLQQCFAEQIRVTRRRAMAPPPAPMPIVTAATTQAATRAFRLSAVK